MSKKKNYDAEVILQHELATYNSDGSGVLSLTPAMDLSNHPLWTNYAALFDEFKVLWYELECTVIRTQSNGYAHMSFQPTEEAAPSTDADKALYRRYKTLNANSMPQQRIRYKPANPQWVDTGAPTYEGEASLNEMEFLVQGENWDVSQPILEAVTRVAVKFRRRL